MAYLNQLLAVLTEPKGMWESLIRWIYSFAGNYGLTIILLTLFIKLVMTPLDVWQKYTQKISTLNQAKIKPEIDAINKRYRNDRAMIEKKSADIYKKHGIKPMGSCLAMIVNLAIILTVFITLINGITNMANYKIEEQYNQLRAVYEDSAYTTKEEKEAAVLAAYRNDDNINESFLWISNIWRKDTNEAKIPNYQDVVSRDWNDNEAKRKGFYTRVTEEEYKEVMQVLIDNERGWNGYYILTILAVATTFFSSKLLSKTNKVKAKDGKLAEDKASSQATKITQFILPVVMGVFTLTASSTFALYLVVSQVFSMLSALAISPLVDKMIANKKEKDEEKLNKPTISYSR